MKLWSKHRMRCGWPLLAAENESTDDREYGGSAPLPLDQSIQAKFGGASLLWWEFACKVIEAVQLDGQILKARNEPLSEKSGKQGL